uniref:RRM domain-containing protein n=1 Tax=Periophthalmus magnuspinnatus TaxID=409849 RepID=A0A3B4AXJ8_9GOBI
MCLLLFSSRPPSCSRPLAFVTLLNGDQAQDAIRSLHHSTVRGRLINVTLQPTDSLLCVTNLPHTYTAQQFEELVRAYGNIERSFLVYSELTAFVTLLNGDQAQDAIRSLHHSTVRGRLINVTLQPTDSLLCVTNLPHTYTAQQFEELVRAYGNIERSFLVYSELTGHSKGYGFVEYMKKDSASRARSELLGRALGDRSLMVQWMDVNQLSHEDSVHSKCVCVDRLPLDLSHSDEFTQLFSETYKPVFCQLAQDEGSAVRGFGVVEYSSAEQAEAVLSEMDRTVVMGQVVRLSLCSPGTSGRSTLAALIAAQGMILSNRKGLLPEPNMAQLWSSMTNPSALHLLMRPYTTSKRGGEAHSFKERLTKRRFLCFSQNAMIGNGLVLQNLLHMQLAQQQLLHIKDKQVSSAPVHQPPGRLRDYTDTVYIYVCVCGCVCVCVCDTTARYSCSVSRVTSPAFKPNKEPPGLWL